MVTTKTEKNIEKNTESDATSRSVSNGMEPKMQKKKITRAKTKKVATEPKLSSMEAKVFNQKGKQSGTVTLPSEVFGQSWNGDLVHQVITSMESSARAGTAHTKNRGEVRGGGKKPWRQNGTGRARHGSSRSPIWRGGGITHGPRTDKNYYRKVNRKMKVKALHTLLSKKFNEGEILFIDMLSLSLPKTKEAKEILGNLGSVKGFEGLLKKKNNSLLLAIDAKNAALEKSFRNFSNIEISEVRNLNPVTVARYKYIAIVNPQGSFESLNSK